jgi:hypothetical protein
MTTNRTAVLALLGLTACNPSALLDRMFGEPTDSELPVPDPTPAPADLDRLGVIYGSPEMMGGGVPEILEPPPPPPADTDSRRTRGNTP